VRSTDQQPLLELAAVAARAGARELCARFGRRAVDVRTKSSATDPVSEADLASERAIRAVLERDRPDDAILGEEGGGQGQRGASGLRWIVDPLDGTVNFLFGVPLFAVSVACADADGTLAGVVLDPLRQECFAATRNGPATLNGERISGSSRGELERALVATGFAYDAHTRARQAAVLARILPAARDIRRGGAAALDLAWCACGRFDAYYERGVKSWDVAAGALIAERAGLAVRRLEARGEDPAGVTVAPPGLIDALCELVDG
jgi:myo-inositol-1(or 4)-monophosphatase